MLRQTYSAYRGSRLWAGLERKYKVDRGLYVLLMPEDDAELNTAALGHVQDIIADRRARGVVLVGDRSVSLPVASESRDAVSAAERLPGVVGAESWTGGEIDAVISFYELYSFTDRLLVVSLTRPFGNGLYRLLDRQGVTKEDAVCLGCLRLRSYGAARG